MIRFLMVFLTFLLITATAALIGIEIPPAGEVILNDTVPMEKHEDEKTSESIQEEKEKADIPPRFIPDEPIELDPSAAEKMQEAENDDSSPKVPTEREIKKAAEPHILEIISIKENAFANLASLEKKIAVDYLSLSGEERADAPKILEEKYLPRAGLILNAADKDVERVLKKLEASLSAVNGPQKIVDEARESYEKEKKETLNSYNELLKSLGQDINLEELLNK